MSTPTLSAFARGLTAETAFDVLAVAKKLKAAGKDVIELQIGDSPYPSSSSAIAAGKAAIDAGHTRYAPSMGLPEFRAALARMVRDEFGIPATADHVVVAPGAKPFEQFFCELFLEPGDAALVFEPAFPTYEPNLARRGARMVTAPLTPENEFRPDLGAVERFLRDEPRAKAVFLNTPHNPTGGVATKADLEGLAALLRGTGVALFSDEPYCHMVWRGRHHSPLAEPGMTERTVAAYTFSKSYSMSGWRCGFAVTAPDLADRIGKMINTSLSCAPPFVQLAGLAAVQHDAAERDRTMGEFKKKVELLVAELGRVPGVSVAMPAGAFYVFPDVRPICRRLGITSHGLAMYLLEGADDARGVACLGGECFGPAGQGFLRLTIAEPDDRLRAAVAFLAEAVTRAERVAAFLAANPKYRAGTSGGAAMSTPAPPAAPLVYPDSDGQPMADNSLQWDWMVKIVGELRELFAGQEVFVAGDLLWYPTEGSLDRQAPDALVAFGRPPGYRGSYKQWEEGNVAPQVVFEVLSPSNTLDEMRRKLRWYEKHGVEEYYLINPYKNHVLGYVRDETGLASVAFMDDFVSPRLGVRFEQNGELKLYTPDGREFRTREDRVREIAEELEGTAEELRKTTLAFEEEREHAAELRREAEAERERAEVARQRAEEAQQRADATRAEADRLREKLRSAGIDPDAA